MKAKKKNGRVGSAAGKMLLAAICALISTGCLDQGGIGAEDGSACPVYASLVEGECVCDEGYESFNDGCRLVGDRSGMTTEQSLTKDLRCGCPPVTGDFCAEKNADVPVMRMKLFNVKRDECYKEVILRIEPIDRAYRKTIPCRDGVLVIDMVGCLVGAEIGSTSLWVRCEGSEPYALTTSACDDIPEDWQEEEQPCKFAHPGAEPTCEGRAYCEKTTLLCVQDCHNELSCDEGLICSREGKCVEPPKPDCTPENERDVCGDGYYCNAWGVCDKECGEGDDCGTGMFCNDSGRCEAVEEPGLHRIDPLPYKPCMSDAECDMGWYCNYAGQCHYECDEKVACLEGFICSDRGRCLKDPKVPDPLEQFPPEKYCVEDSQCPEDKYCDMYEIEDVIGICRPRCEEDINCGPGKFCDPKRRCQPCPPEGCPGQVAEEPFAMFGEACERDEQCTSGTFCKDGVCAMECHPGSNLCAVGKTCDKERGRCIDDPEVAVPVADKPLPTVPWTDLMHHGCLSQKDCPSNSLCRDGVCTFECLSDEDCGLPGTAHCSCMGQCIDGPRTTEGCPYVVSLTCNRSDECPEGTACSSGQCRYVCLSRLGEDGRVTSWGCDSSMTCDMQARRCVPGKKEKPVRTRLPWPRCGSDEECPAPTRCLYHLGLCSADCLSDAHCDSGQVCGPRGVCRAAGTKFEPQRYPACKTDAQCQAGSYCAAGICRMDCVSGVPALACPEEQTCGTDGQCRGEKRAQ